MAFYLTMDSVVGGFALTWRESPNGPRVMRIELPSPDGQPDPGSRTEAPARDVALSAYHPGSGPHTPGSSPVIARLAEQIRAFLAGEDQRFDHRLLDLEVCSPFQRRVLLAEAGIPRGKVSTYGRLARHLGAPRAARAVGRALARNPFPIVIPCHRAIRGDGHLGGFQGGLALKRRLLEYEGHAISPAGKLLEPRYHY